MDSGIKLFIAVVLGITPFFIDCYIAYILLMAYFFLLTVLSGIPIRIITKSIITYTIIIIMPYFFGLLIAIVFYRLTGKYMGAFYSSFEEVALRLLKLFILWYAGSLYLNSTPMQSVIGLFYKLFSPLKQIGVPVSDFLKIIMCVMNELKELAPEVKKSFSESLGQIFRSGKDLSKGKIKAIGYVLVSFIVNSFQRLGKVEEDIKQIETKDIFIYKFTISRVDILVILSLILLLGSIIIISDAFCISGMR